MHRITHIISGLGSGGAEVTLERLIGHSAQSNFNYEVISLSGDGPIGERLRGTGVPVHLLDFRNKLQCIQEWRRLAAILRENPPALVHSWMAHANLIGGLAARTQLDCPVLWSFHQAEVPAHAPWTTRTAVKLCASVSRRLSNAVVNCSQSAMDARINEGYPEAMLRCIPNGIATASWQPNTAHIDELRAQLSIDADVTVIAFPARWHADKDPHTFFAAAKQVLQKQQDMVFLLFGEGLDKANDALGTAIKESGFPKAFRPLGYRKDVAALMNLCDICVLSSRTEAMPNVILEAMACATPVVATDVGDIASMLSGKGELAPAGDANQLAQAILRLLELPVAQRKAIGESLRSFCIENFSLDAMHNAYADLYHSLIQEEL